MKSISDQEVEAEVEICAVDDCSSDGSLEILKSFKKSYDSCPKRSMKIISHSSNLGAAAARNTALNASNGEYILFVDADDTLNKGALGTVLEAVKKTEPDIVGWNWLLDSPQGKRYMRQAECSTPQEAIEALMGGSMKWNLWLFLTRRSLWNGIRFTSGMNMGEDMAAMIKLMSKASSFSQLHSALYTYEQGPSSISRKMTDENLRQVCGNLQDLEEFLQKTGYGQLLESHSAYLKLNIKLPLLVSEDKNDYLRWEACFPEASGAILQNRFQPLHTRILQYMASKRMWNAVLFYNKVIYGQLYRYLCQR